MSYFLPLVEGKHQFASAKPLYPELPMLGDGCIMNDNIGHEIDGYRRVEDELLVPTAVECADRLHAFRDVETSSLTLTMFCMSPACPLKGLKVVAEGCETCVHRRGR